MRGNGQNLSGTFITWGRFNTYKILQGGLNKVVSRERTYEARLRSLEDWVFKKSPQRLAECHIPGSIILRETLSHRTAKSEELNVGS